MRRTIDVDGVRRPIDNNEGGLIHPTEEGVRNFWRWFGDSRVVDENGRPLVVYHATTSSFDAFETRNGAHFGTIAHAEEIVDRHDFNGNASGLNVMPVYLSIRRLKRVTDIGPDSASWGCAKRSAWADGYDGIVYINEFEAAEDASDAYVAFRPEQVKSALGNSGAFDPASPDLCCRVDERALARNATHDQGSARRRIDEDFEP